VGIGNCLSVHPTDHLLGGLPAGGRQGLAQEALCLPGVRDAAGREALRPARRQPPVRDLQQEQAALSGERVPEGPRGQPTRAGERES